MIAAALTFAAHGLYAMGYYPVPLNFRMMTTEILSISEEGSLRFLEIFGWLFFTCSAGEVRPLSPASWRTTMRLFLTTRWILGLSKRWCGRRIGPFRFGFCGCCGGSESKRALKSWLNLEASFYGEV